VLVPVSLPDLGDRHPAEFDFTFLGEGVFRCDQPVSRAVLERLAAEIEALEPPFAARAVRRSQADWVVGARAVNAEVISFAGPLVAESLEVTVSPDGDRVGLVDGEAPAGVLDPGVAAAFDELARRGETRFEAFVARADKVDEGRWQLTIDPL
jgi:hypothetical protein